MLFFEGRLRLSVPQNFCTSKYLKYRMFEETVFMRKSEFSPLLKQAFHSPLKRKLILILALMALNFRKRDLMTQK